MSVHAHVGSRRTYYLVFTGLLVGTALTVFAAQQNLGILNAPVALLIAGLKALGVVLFFMHVKDSNRLTKVTVLCGVFWLGILFVLFLTDYLSRAWS
jgi:cytochrome c oxidase subunit IV